MSEWIEVKKQLPTKKIGGQVKVIFCGPNWGWPIVGLFTKWEDHEEWLEYDQQEDRYYSSDCDPPTWWMEFPRVPDKG